MSAFTPILLTGIGKGVCVALHQLGAEVFALSRTQSDLDELQKQVNCLLMSFINFSFNIFNVDDMHHFFEMYFILRFLTFW